MKKRAAHAAPRGEMLNYYQFMVPRLNGGEIKKRFSWYRSLVRKGVAGFIVFGGELETVRTYIKKLQDEAAIPLIISADLERGLGQQLRGGTDFPPAMALSSAYTHRAGGNRPEGHARADLAPIRKAFRAVAREARYAGINTIFAPVLDINTNPDNPIIAARAFGEEPGIVSLLGMEMIRVLQRERIVACGKHFPGHGDTSVDSHIRLPVLRHGMRRLRKVELRPFVEAVDAGVGMLMLGHLGVPALDPSGIPVSLSAKAVQFIRDDMGYGGMLITDALNMGGIGRYSEEEASSMALEAGVDLLLHPSDPGLIAAYLSKHRAPCVPERVLRFRRGLGGAAKDEVPPFELHRALAARLSAEAVSSAGRWRIAGSPLLIILNDEEEEKGGALIRSMQTQFPGTRVFRLSPASGSPRIRKRTGESMIVAIFSETRAWKGGTGRWLDRQISRFRHEADLYISFGSPYLLDGLGQAPRICAFWDADHLQEAMPGVLKRCGTGPAGRCTRPRGRE